MMKKALITAAVTSMLLAPPAFAKRGDSGHLNIIYWQAPSILNPFLSGGTKDGDASALVVEPLDYEDFVSQRHRLGERDPLAHLLEFPKDDLDVKVLPRKVRTMGHVMPEEPM